MKSISNILFLTLLLSLLGCAKEAEDDESTSTLTSADVASFAGSGSTLAQSMSDLAIGYDSTPPSLANSLNMTKELASSPRTQNSSLNNYIFNSSTNYWELSQTLSSSGEGGSFSYVYNMSIGLWESGSLTETISSALEQVTMFGSLAFTISTAEAGNSVITMTIGNGVSNPFTWTGIDSSTVTMNGSFDFNITSAGQNITMEMTLTSMTIDRGGSNTYPSGTMTISASDGSTTFSGTVVYDGTSTAVATVNGSSVDVDLSSAAFAENFLR